MGRYGRANDITEVVMLPIDKDIATWRLAQARRSRIKWVAVILIGALLLLALALTERAEGACATPVSAMGRITHVSRTIHPLPIPVRWYTAGYTFGEPTYFFGLTLRTRFRVGETVLIRGCADDERQVREATVSRP